MIKDIAALLPAAAVALAIAVATKLFFKHQQKLKKVLELEASKCRCPRAECVLTAPVAQCTKCLAELPSPPAMRLLGHNLAVVRHGITQAPTLIQRWSEQYGDAYTIKLDTLWLVLSDPKDIKVRANLCNMGQISAVLDMRPGTFDRAKPLCRLFIQCGFGGVVAQNGETWKRYRRITSSAFR
eukprot:1766-Heterococcus_DN1.PRE.5